MRRTLPLLLSLLSTPALAAEPDWQGTLFAGLRGGGELEEIANSRQRDIEPSPAYGLALGRALTPDTRWELSWSGQGTDLEDRDEDVRVDHLHLAGVYEPVRRGKRRAYVLASVGLTRLASDRPGADDELEVSVSAGAGVKVPISDSAALRLEGRGYGVLTEADAAVLCAGGCALRYAGRGFFQVEGTAGLTFSF